MITDTLSRPDPSPAKTVSNLTEKPAATILVADDDPTSLQILETALGLIDPTPRLVKASNGAEAIRCIDREAPDLVVTDVHMPGADGLQVLAHVVNNRLAAPVILVSGYSTPELRAELMAEGACLLLEKPVRPARLVEAVDDLLSQQSRGHLEGFNLSGILQLIEMESTSCNVGVTCEQGRKGSLIFLQGRLIDAALGDLTGDAAALEILSFASPQVDIRELTSQRPATVTQSVTQLLLEHARLDDQDNRDVYEALESLTELSQADLASDAAEVYQALLDQLASLQGFAAASVLDRSSGRTLVTSLNGSGTFAEADVVSFSSSVCSLIEVEQGLASLTGQPGPTDFLLRQRQSWHVVRSLPGPLALHLILDRGGNPALAQYQLNRWLTDHAQQLIPAI